MTEKVRAVFDGKVFFPEEPVDLKVNGHYLLRVEPVETEKPIKNGDVESDPAFDLSSLTVTTGITDLAAQHDHYLYGTPKRETND